MSKGDVLIALQISNQYSYLWFHQSNPVEDRTSLFEESVVPETDFRMQIVNLSLSVAFSITIIIVMLFNWNENILVQTRAFSWLGINFKFIINITKSN